MWITCSSLEVLSGVVEILQLDKSIHNPNHAKQRVGCQIDLLYCHWEGNQWTEAKQSPVDGSSASASIVASGTKTTIKVNCDPNSMSLPKSNKNINYFSKII